MHYEVEQKYRVSSHKPVVAALTVINAELDEPIEQIDFYYRHPQRDFAQTDEAFRLRTVGDRNYLTYKGPKVDQSTKTRREEEVPIADGRAARETCDAILRHLGFDPAATVHKRRVVATTTHRGHAVEIALDDVDHLGHFVELEIGVDADAHDSAAVDAAKQSLAELAEELSLSEVERRSYLELLLSPSH
jgi:adenylate cyclase, class 2